MAFTHHSGGGSPAAQQQPPPGGGTRGGEQDRRSCQALAALLIPVSFALLVAQPPQPGRLLFEVYMASILLMFFTGILLIGLSTLTCERAPKMINMTVEKLASLRAWATWVGSVSLLVVLVLWCCLQLPSSSLIRVGLLFVTMLLIATTPLLLLGWSEYRASSPPPIAEHR
ncbi:unnamed protein product [Spirodela intermedia]|uniref:Uncharacterized protein n=2 Tax=Spirodela intermedia TaxID=51605 RepID=A0A7I8ID54_SPIIN|nr:unnamed protein product [Spirodela intermedia]CAA6655324.1 unnamed protein product [Spirodela intermedia]CAA7390562.1 unnamed protein product [Spirodela intermedia]